ncbi:pyruvate formate-lyase-activating protein [Sedimentisphaera salicampi]|uniref:pyruvate formate-lyase-activating protein n=1 Tax=Sedimentisphaera salicampi TaxID=1941349 RepID=UPI0019587AFC|nr:pyruvate formate-lyase-activating protein [Sedimentisphaera salicampi]
MQSIISVMFTEGYIHSIQSMGTLDGPGTRCVVFLQGCSKRCIYCHNPDSWKMNAGEKTKSSEIIKLVERYRPYYGEKGGITLSGGEPLLQPQFAAEIFEMCRERGIHTALDTAGARPDEKTEKVLSFTDLVLLDIKHCRDENFREITGEGPEEMFEFLDYITKAGIEMWVRQVIVPEINDSQEDMKQLADLLEGRDNLKKLELLPYHSMGREKWEKLGLDYPLENTKPLEKSEIAGLIDFLRGKNLPAC